MEKKQDFFLEFCRSYLNFMISVYMLIIYKQNKLNMLTFILMYIKELNICTKFFFSNLYSTEHQNMYVILLPRNYLTHKNFLIA